MIKSVSFVLNLFAEEGAVDEGTGSIQPFFSSDTYQHMQMDEQPSVPIEWSVDGTRMTISLKSEPKSTCTATLVDGGEKFEVAVAGCAPLARNVSLETVTLAFSSGNLRPADR